MFRNLHEFILRAPEDGTGSDTPSDDAPAAAEPETVLYGEGEGDKPADETKAEDAADKPAEDDKAGGDDDGEKASDEPDPLKEVPDDGKYEFTMPEGIELDAEFAERASPALKDAGVTREQANKLAQFMAEDRKAQYEAWSRTQEEWVKEARSDKEFGGDKFDASIGGAKRVLEQFGTPELREYLTASGGGNHPEVIRFMARVGNAISDDQPVGSETPAASKKSPEETLYGATTPMERGK